MGLFTKNVNLEEVNGIKIYKHAGSYRVQYLKESKYVFRDKEVSDEEFANIINDVYLSETELIKLLKALKKIDPKLYTY